MFNFKMFAKSLVVAMALAMVLAPSSKALAGDDVFVDEGDGDFDSSPIPAAPPADLAAEVAPDEKDTKPTDVAPVVESKPEAKPEELAAPAPVQANDMPAPVSPVEEKMAPVEEPAKKKSKKKKKHETADASVPVPKQARKSHASHSTKHGAGMFVVTKSDCPMTREPASDSTQMIVVKPARKIWVEKVDNDWVKGFNKAGEPGYISKDCVN